MHELDEGYKHNVRPNVSVDNFSWDAYIRVENLEALYDDFKSNGAIIFKEITYPDDRGMKEFAIRDLDGYMFYFGEEVH